MGGGRRADPLQVKQAHTTYRLASVGLVAVLLFLAGLAILNATTTRSAADAVERETAVSDAYNQAAQALSAEQREAQSPTPRRERFDDQVVAFREALQNARLRGDAREAREVAALTQAHDGYLATLTASGPAGAAAPPVQTGFDRLDRRLAEVARTRRASAADRVFSLSQRGDATFVRTIVAFSAGLLLLGLFGGIIRAFQARRRAAEAAQVQGERDLAAVTRATHELSSNLDGASARNEICRATVEVSNALMAVLWEPDREGWGLKVSGAAGAGVPDGLTDLVMPLSAESSGVLQAYTTAESLLVSDLAADPLVAHPLERGPGAVSTLYRPVTREGVALGVLAVSWERRITTISDRVADVTSLLVQEASVAIERTELIARLRAASRVDDLTGLMNRRAYDFELPRELARSRRDGRPVCAARIVVGGASDDPHIRDRTLKALADRWREALRLTDVLARYDGNEFALILPACPLADGMMVIGRLTEAMPGVVGSVACWDGAEPAEAMLARVAAELEQQRPVLLAPAR